jgi:ferrous iron transport protein A
MSTLETLENGLEATITAMPAGECRRRLEALGLREGKRVRKVSGMPFCGPVTVLLDGRQIAIGHGVACRVEVAEPMSKEGTSAGR